MNATPFQIVGIALMALMAIGSLAAMAKGWTRRRDALLWCLVFVTAAVAIAQPSLTQRIARVFGIKRGADLVLYCSVVVMMASLWMIYVRLRRLRRAVTLLVRKIALLEAELEDQGTDRTKRGA